MTQQMPSQRKRQIEAENVRLDNENQRLRKALAKIALLPSGGVASKIANETLDGATP